MAFTGRLGQSDSALANIRLGYWAAAGPPPSGLSGVSHGIATVAGTLTVHGPVALAGTSAGVATVSGTLAMIWGRQITLTQEIVEADVLQTDRLRMLFQLVVEVDGDNWGFGTGRILSGQFV